MAVQRRLLRVYFVCTVTGCACRTGWRVMSTAWSIYWKTRMLRSNSAPIHRESSASDVQMLHRSLTGKMGNYSLCTVVDLDKILWISTVFLKYYIYTLYIYMETKWLSSIHVFLAHLAHCDRLLSICLSVRQLLPCKNTVVHFWMDFVEISSQDTFWWSLDSFR